MSEFAVCPWPVDTTCLPSDWSSFEPEVWTYSVAMASASLHALTAGRVGGCPITVRPCKPQGAILPAYGLYGPTRPLFSPGITAEGLWINSCGCDSGCGCSASCSITLPGPVGRVYQIKIDGEEQDLEDYRLDNGSRLVYQGDMTLGCPFPANQDLRLRDTEPGTWSVTYLNAIEPDVLAAQAAAKLAYQFALACQAGASKAKCQLPANVVNIVRTGITISLNTGVWPSGTTGIREIDAWLYLYNPKGRKTQSRVLSLDDPGPIIQGRTIEDIPYDGNQSDTFGGFVLDGGGA